MQLSLIFVDMFSLNCPNKSIIEFKFEKENIQYKVNLFTIDVGLLM